MLVLATTAFHEKFSPLKEEHTKGCSEKHDDIQATRPLKECTTSQCEVRREEKWVLTLNINDNTAVNEHYRVEEDDGGSEGNIYAVKLQNLNLS